MADAATRSGEAVPDLSDNLRSWIVTFVAAAASYLLLSRGFFYHGGVVQVAIFVGVMAGMIALNYVQAAIAGVGSIAVFQLLAPPTLPYHAKLSAADWLVSLVLVAGVSILFAVVRSRLGAGRKALSVGVSAVLVVWIIVNLWAPMMGTGTPPSAYGPLMASTIREVPQPGGYVNDDAIYRRVFYLLHHGQGYYQAYQNGWLGLRQRLPLPISVTAYRLPTMYWLWRVLPDDAFMIVIAFMVFASVGVVAAAFIAGQIVGPRFAPLGAAAVAAYAMGVGISVYVTYVDIPAACIALVGIALFVRGAVRNDIRFAWGAAAVLLLAALTREILAYLIVLAALSALLQPARERLRKAIPWLVALAIFAAGYALHAYEVVTRVQDRTYNLTYLGGSPRFALDALTRFSTVFTGYDGALALLFFIGVAGAWAAHKRTGLPFAVFALAALILPVLAMMKLGNPGIDAQGHQVNYWGELFMPLALSLWPAVLLLLP